MREVVVSAATLAGLVGLACLYGNGKGIGRSRVARDADFSSITDMDYEVLGESEMPGEVTESELIKAERDFIAALGYFDENADIPMFLKDDVAQYASKDAAKKSVQFVAKCMKNNECKENAVRKVKNWSYEHWNTIKSDDNRATFMKPYVKSLVPIKTPEYDWTADIKALYKAERNKNIKMAYGESLAFEACTPYDNKLWRCPPDQDLTPGPSNAASSSWSEDAQQLALLETQKEAAPSLLDFESVVSEGARNNLNQNTFANFGKGNKIIYVIPNGIPIFMQDEVILDKAARNAGRTSQFRNYWDWFVAFNDKYIGIKKGTNVKNRSNTGWWFIRQDFESLPYTKAVVKASKRFPWSRFETRLVVPQYTASAPKLSSTYKTINEAMFGDEARDITIDMKIPAEYSKDGNDCFVFWFHQYVPFDVVALNNEANQERINAIESVCTVIHIWVGLDVRNDVDFGASTRVVKYIQKILQPSLSKAEHIDSDLNGYFYVSSLTSLAISDNSEGAQLLEKVYNIVAMVKSRSRCLLANPAVNVMDEVAAYAAANARETDYFEDIDFLFDTFESASTTTENVVETTILDLPESTVTMGSTTTANVTTPWYTSESVEDIPPEYGCCGVSTDATKYDMTKQICCPNGVLVGIDEGDMCI